MIAVHFEGLPGLLYLVEQQTKKKTLSFNFEQQHFYLFTVSLFFWEKKKHLFHWSDMRYNQCKKRLVNSDIIQLLENKKQNSGLGPHNTTTKKW